MTQMNYLGPGEILSELFAGLIITLSVTLAASVVDGGDEAGAKAAPVGAISANVAWVIIDAALYMINSAFDRRQRLRFAHEITSNHSILESVTKAEDASSSIAAFIVR